MLIDEQFKKDFIKNYNYAILMEKTTNNDYQKTKELIKESESIIKRFNKKNNGTIKDKDREINELKNQLQNLQNETNSLKKQLNNIPLSIRKIYT